MTNRTLARFAADAIARNDPAWTFHHVMDNRDRDAFDAALVETKHPLAERAGTQFGRFWEYVKTRRA